MIGCVSTICLSVLTYIWLIKNRSSSIDPTTALPSYEVVVPASVAMTNVGEYVNSLHALEIKTTAWDANNYEV
ncbi:MAG: hypothetical protein MRQ09_06060 [Candidatus Midichloria sp.]|nr:hypothetical protein [Candidatus Midichloria sp.]